MTAVNACWSGFFFMKFIYFKCVFIIYHTPIGALNVVSFLSVMDISGWPGCSHTRGPHSVPTTTDGVACYVASKMIAAVVV